jgi:hypothetical protein
MVYNWPEFKAAFMNYIRTTCGLFTLLDDTSFPWFNLDAFLRAQTTRVGFSLPVTHIEMLMSLACFIHIHEARGLVTINTFPDTNKLQLKTLIQQNLLQLSPFSQVKTGCLEFTNINTDSEDPTAVAAAAA